MFSPFFFSRVALNSCYTSRFVYLVGRRRLCRHAFTLATAEICSVATISRRFIVSCKYTKYIMYWFLYEFYCRDGCMTTHLYGPEIQSLFDLPHGSRRYVLINTFCCLYYMPCHIIYDVICRPNTIYPSMLYFDVIMR